MKRINAFWANEVGAGSYSTKDVSELSGVSFRQLDYWDRTDLLKPTINGAKGSGTLRRYSASDLDDVQMIKALLDAGVSLEYIREEGPTRTAERVIRLVSKALKQRL